MQRLVIVFVLFVPAGAAADDHRPTAGLFRATPGFGYSWDRDVMCSVEGLTMVGGWHLGTFVTPSLLVGASIVIGAGTVHDKRCPVPSVDDSDVRFAMSAVIGPGIDWYPLDRGLHFSADLGWGFVTVEETTEHGVGGSVVAGYDWSWPNAKTGGNDRFGLALQLTMLRTTRAHATMTPALVMTIGWD